MNKPQQHGGVSAGGHSRLRNGSKEMSACGGPYSLQQQRYRQHMTPPPSLYDRQMQPCVLIFNTIHCYPIEHNLNIHRGCSSSGAQVA